MEEFITEPKESRDPFQPIADMLFAYLRDAIYDPLNSSLDIGQLPEAFSGFGEGLRYFCSLVLEARAFARELSVGNLNCAVPSPSNEIAASMKNLHASLKHLTWQTQQVAKGDYKQRIKFMGDFSEAFNNMIAQLEKRQQINLDEKTRLEQYVNWLLANSPNPVLLFDRQGRLTYASDSYLRYCNISGVDLVLGKSINELFAPHISEEDLNAIEQLFEMVTIAKLAAETANDMDFCDNGYNRHFKVQMTPLLDIDRNAEGLMVSLIDMTGSIQAYREAERARSVAEQSTRAKSDFLAKMSHEIRTPMNAIIGMAELALREDMPTAAREHIRTIKQAGANLLSIVNDILDFSKIESGKLEIVPRHYSFSSLINDVISVIRMRVIETQVRFVVNIDCDIPNALFGDEIRIRQALLNLLSNAIKYTEKGFVSFTVIGENTDESTVSLTMEVADNGKGIKQEDLGKLFGEFTQIDSVYNKNIEGTGLGLAITRNIVHAMGGDISVHSEYGKGSTFIVTLPQTFRIREKLASVENPQEKSVLVYERREMYANSIVCTVDNLGVECRLVTSDVEFREKMTTKAYPFVFVSSAHLANAKRILSQLGSNTQIVLLTGFGEAIADSHVSSLAMPVHAISVANLLNGVAGSFMYGTHEESDAEFTAPEAKVLIVDDINTNLKVAEGLLLPYKMQVTLCKSGLSAIESIKLNYYDLIFMDHMMPGMDGIETTLRIRSFGGEDPYYTSVPIIALTANAVAGTREMFLKNGFDDFLSKPIDTTKLNAVLGKWIPQVKQQKLTEGGRTAALQEQDADKALVITGLDVKKGMAMTGGTRKNYVQALAVFHQDGLEKIEEIRTCLETNDQPLYVTHVHALKSASASIGASDLSDAAKILEAAGRQEDWAFIKTHSAAFLQALETLLRNIHEALLSDRGGERKDAVNLEILKTELVKLRTGLNILDISVIDEAVNTLWEFTQVADIGASVGNILHKTLIGEYGEAVLLINALLLDVDQGNVLAHSQSFIAHTP